MKYVVCLITIIILSGAQGLNIDRFGVVDTIVVNTGQCELADTAYRGLMPEVLVTAPRHQNKTVETGMISAITVHTQRIEDIFVQNRRVVMSESKHSRCRKANRKTEYFPLRVGMIL